MTEKQRFMVYIKIGNLIANVRKNKKLKTNEAIRLLLEKKIIQKIEDLETGYYLESPFYLAEIFELA